MAFQMYLNKLIVDSDNPDITEERLKATFDTDALAAELKGGYKAMDRRAELHDPYPQSYMTREEKLDNSCRKVTNLFKQISEFVDPTNHTEMVHLLRSIVGVEGYPLALHILMFVPTLQNQCDDEQMERWLGKAMKAEIIGTYAQTEMGHGTNLSSIETLATYDRRTEEFILHSPTTTSMKWWPGGLGKSCNHAIVVAKLIINGHDYGPHNFFVQLRDSETHSPLPGVVVGDIGPKFGINALDNGFLKFDHYRIPRKNMLMKHAKVAADGTYTKPKHSKLGYSTMVYVRTEMVMHQALYLSYSMIIAIRYSAIRRQGEIVPGVGEVRILDYQTQQYRLFPHLARTIAFHYTGQEIRTGLIADLHALSSGLKAVVTFQSSQGIEQARMSCGGHGYSDASYLPTIFSCAVGACTYEGENMVMLLQLSRYLMKAAQYARNGKPLGPLVRYLLHPGNKHSKLKIPNDGGTIQTTQNPLDYANYLLDYEHICRQLVFKAYGRLNELRAGGLSSEEAWNMNAVEMCRASRAHARMFIATAFFNRIHRVEDASIREVLEDLLLLHLNYELVDQAHYLDGYLSSIQLSYMKEELYRLLLKIRPNVVSIVDSFDVPDRELQSVLGRRDGHVYENLYKYARDSALNKHDVFPTFEKYLKPMMKRYESKI
ncbi:unnamed protein product [Angiostrongylus costaricensis]|uniref:Acyl-coenzyme A oxidase n=1 Tax=Angiostrongylus costaricensis TaxID=334426 RepID=A0A158PI03_ANGCS|nr:unnamed protein product [Angiostrongylus costaricensis]